MKISIVIIAYNEEKYIENCLKSVFNQKIQADEVIVVDNNCTDNTVQIARKYPVKIIKEKKQGMIFARNAGFNIASGDIIIKTDADTVVPIDWVEKIKERFSDEKIDGLGGLIKYDDYFIKTPFLSKCIFKGLFFLSGYVLFGGPNYSLRKSTWENIKSHICNDDKKVHEDFNIAIAIQKQGGKVFLDENIVVTSSSRRMKFDPYSMYIEYPVRTIKTFIHTY